MTTLLRHYIQFTLLREINRSINNNNNNVKNLSLDNFLLSNLVVV